jgi:hypothetical protein
MDFLNASHENWFDKEAMPDIDMSAILSQLPMFDCLKLAPFAMMLPHWTRFAKIYEQFIPFLAMIGMLKEGRMVLGVDNETAVFNVDGKWEVGGAGVAVVIREGLKITTFKAGETLDLTPTP